MNKLVPHNPTWASEFQSESDAIATVLGDNVLKVHHIGSTSIAEIYAKPIIDMLVEVITIDSVDQSDPAMVKLGYEGLGEYGISGRRYFRKFNRDDVRTHHVHIFNVGSEHISRHLAFRDFLIAHPLKAQEYSNLKQTLANNHRDDWDQYLAGKDSFIKQTEREGLEWFNHR